MAELTREEIQRIAEEYVRKRFSQIGTKGGRVSSEAKRKSSAANAKKALAARWNKKNEVS